MNERISRSTALGILLCCGASLVSVSVLSAEDYDAGRVRNLDVLLEQEQKRTADLDDEIKRAKEELAELVARTRELSAQVQVTRHQMARLQQEVEAINESSEVARKAAENVESGVLPPKGSRSTATE